MRKHLIGLTLGLVAAVVPWVAQPAAALRCVHPSHNLTEYALIVQAEVMKVEPHVGIPESNAQPETITFTVHRYFKGEGSPELEAVFDMGGWVPSPAIGSEIIVGLRWDEHLPRYTAGPCALQINAQPANPYEEEIWSLIHQQYGEGQPPEPENVVTDPPGGIGAHPLEPRGQWFLWGSFGAMIAFIAAVRLWCRGN